MHHRINIVSLNLVLTKAEPELCSLPPCASFTSVCLAGGWWLRPPSGQEQPQGAARDPRVDRRRGPVRSGGGDGGDDRAAPRDRRHRRHVHPLARSAAPAMPTMACPCPPPSPPKWCLLAPRGGHLRVCQPFPCVLTVFSHGADYRSMRALSSAATEALVKDIAARLESEPPPLPVERSLSEPMTEPLVD